MSDPAERCYEKDQWVYAPCQIDGIVLHGKVGVVMHREIGGSIFIHFYEPNEIIPCDEVDALRARLAAAEAEALKWRRAWLGVFVDYCELVPVEWLHEMIPPELKQRLEAILEEKR